MKYTESSPREPSNGAGDRYQGGSRATAPGKRTQTMSLQSRSTGPAQRSTASPATTSQEQTSSTDPTSGSGGGGGTEPRGGGTYVVQNGDTLSRIAVRTYGQGQYWRQIMQANPTKVFQGGNLILVGDELQLPVIQVPVAATEPTEEPPVTSTAPPQTNTSPPPPADTNTPPTDTRSATSGAPPSTPAVEPRTESTEYGDFVVYPDNYVGPLPGTDEQGEHVRESEYRQILAEREAAAVAERERTLESVNDLLSYGAFDWAITDGEATEALNLLGALPMSQLRIAVSSINTQRLLDNLPASARRTEAFAKVIVAMGPDAYRGFVQELMSYGLFDWAVTDGDVQVVADILEVLPPAEQTRFLLSLEPTQLSRLANNLSSGVELSDPLLKVMFDAMPDDDLDALQSVFERRFNIDLESWFLPRWMMSVGERWDATGLRQLWILFEQLPPGHIQDNERLDTFLRASQTDGSGVYFGGFDSGVVSYSGTGEMGGYGSIMVPDGAGGTKDVGLNSHVNLFNTVVRHEVGHAVDADIGASEEGGYVRTAANAGEWQAYDSTEQFVNAIIGAGGGMSGHGYADEAVYEQAMHRAVSKEKDFTEALADIDESVAAPDASVQGPVAAVYEKELWHPDDSPWYNKPDRQDVGGRLWQRPYGSGEYVSFLKDARVNHGVSSYQFRAPGEWFAEAYAAYYSDNDGPEGNPVGTRLRTRDTATADWFDENVDQGHSLQQRTDQAPGGGAGGGAGGTGGAAGGGAGAGGS